MTTRRSDDTAPHYRTTTGRRPSVVRSSRLTEVNGVARDPSAGADLVTKDELVVEFALTRLDHPDLDLEEIAALLVRRAGPDRMLQFAAQNLAVRDELRGGAFESAVEFVLRTVLTLRDDPDE